MKRPRIDFFVRISVDATQLCCNLAASVQRAGAMEPGEGEGPVVVTLTSPKHTPPIPTRVKTVTPNLRRGQTPASPRSAETG